MQRNARAASGGGVNLIDRWRRMERRESIGYWIGMTGVLLLVAWFELDGFGLALIDFGLGFSTDWIIVVFSIGLIAIGAWISPPPHWRWGKVPVATKDPSHERSVEALHLPKKQILQVPQRNK